ncbi:VanZ family protein [Serpentinicella sp. ANB-PHB4]|uniref:VanZ family protein n=1 Tax=Serpentinicella sp. ANB-PHB4 TaxID=3074076 RepID=UPI0028658A60|nr:VanZ family protein [Serpentinicella sp. ANB-PHB4]MDR5659949.1 VanZ family protein [Serpentinicella sp. ANB-PHB4]
MNKKKVILICSWLGVLLWMGVIFFFSHQPADASSELSEGFTEAIFQAIERVAPNIAEGIDLRQLHHIIRKYGHFFVYFVLGVVVLNAIRRSGKDGLKSIIIAFIICVVYAISDEVHQTFIPGRSGEVTDVIIDSVGAAVGIGFYMAVKQLGSWIGDRR